MNESSCSVFLKFKLRRYIHRWCKDKDMDKDKDKDNLLRSATIKTQKT